MGLEPQKKKRRRSPRQKIRKELPPRDERGRTLPFVPTDEQRRKVENLTAAEFSTIQIAAALDISTSTLEKHFRAELVGGRNRVHTDIAHGILQGARDGDRTLQIYASKARMGWCERRVSASGNGETPPGTTWTISITG